MPEESELEYADDVDFLDKEPILSATTGYSWAAPYDILRKLNVCHRYHGSDGRSKMDLRQILNIKYPTIISNKKLYKLCNTTPLSDRVTNQDRKYSVTYSGTQITVQLH